MHGVGLRKTKNYKLVYVRSRIGLAAKGPCRRIIYHAVVRGP